MHIVFFSSQHLLDGDSGQPICRDDRLLAEALIRQGAQVSVVAWESEASVRLPGRRIDLALLRSTCNAHLSPEDFLASLEQICSLMPMRDALAVVRWNLNKYVYLRDLAQAGFPIIPTIWQHPNERRSLSRVLAATGWRRAVLLPALSANHFGTCVFTCEHEPMQVAQSHLERFLRCGRTMMLEPYFPAVQEAGEHCFVFVGGTFSHAFVKAPFGTSSPALDEPLLINLREDELMLACRIMRWVESRFGKEALLWGRVDLIRDEQGALRVMGLELISPLLHLEYGEALPRLLDLLLAPGSGPGCSRGQEYSSPSLPIQYEQEGCR